jgi:hypothetical protein
MIDSVTHADFAQQLNTKFQIQVDADKRIDLTMVELSELKLSPRQEQFAIVFRGPLEVFLGQGMRDFEHEQMGKLPLFIVPISKDDEGVYYEAVFNRLPKAR